MTLLAAPRRVLVSVVFAGTAIALNACGSGGAAATNKLDGLSAAQAVQQAFDQLTKDSYKGDLTQDTTYDTSGLSPDLAAATATSLHNMQSTSSESVESPQRLKMTIHSASLSKPIYLVSYDGKVYASADDTTYKEAPFLSSLASQLTVAQTSDLASHLEGLTDAGKESGGTAGVEHYQATVSAAYVQNLIGSVLGGLNTSADITSALTSAIVSSGSSVDLLIDRHTGTITDEHFNLTLSMDLSKLSSQVPANAGVIKVIGKTELKFHDYGASLGLKQPTSSGTLTVAEFGQLFQ